MYVKKLNGRAAFRSQGDNLMAEFQFQIAPLRKQHGLSQQQLAALLGVAPQTVSKWETGVTFPDIALLPQLSGIFGVSVDELMGLKPLPDAAYIPTDKGKKGYWGRQLDYLTRTRSSFWNQDYIGFLVKKVWKLTKPVRVLDCGCGYGFLGSLLLPLLPEGSTYTGVDFDETLIREGKAMLCDTDFDVSLHCADFMEWMPEKASECSYDLVLCQAVLRHIDRAEAFLERMVSFTRSGGITACFEVDRELECDGLYIEGMDYGELCSRTGLRSLWKKERECQGRDYAIGIRLPVLMERMGLVHVDIRLNDKVRYISPAQPDYEQAISDLVRANHWMPEDMAVDTQAGTEGFMNHGMSRQEAESYYSRQRKIASFLNRNRDNLSILQTLGLLISYGYKP